jgi:hypothetical protein
VKPEDGQDPWCVVRGAWCVRSRLPARFLTVNALLQPNQRATNLFGVVDDREGLDLRGIAKSPGKVKLTRNFATRPNRNLKKLRQFSRPAPTAALRDVRAHRNSCPSHLRHQTEHLGPWKSRSQRVNGYGELLGIRPTPELREVLHQTVISASESNLKTFGIQGPRPLRSHRSRRVFHAPRTTHHAPRLWGPQ